MRILVATRSGHKLQEIQELAGSVEGLELLSLADVDLPPAPEEDSIEAFDTFEENALAKARYFARRTGAIVLADDSGLCVDALDGAPGVWSKRFSQRTDLDGTTLDHANNDHLLDSLRGTPPAERTAHYVCVVAIVTPDDREALARGTVDGVILEQPRGSGGFGYDPLFFIPELNATFAEVAPAVKNSISHRSRAIAAALPTLKDLAADS